MSPAPGKSLSALVQDLRERAWDASVGRDRRAAIDTDDIQAEIERRLTAIRRFRGTEAQEMLDILDGVMEVETEAEDARRCASRSNASLRCESDQRMPHKLHGAYDASGHYQTWK